MNPQVPTLERRSRCKEWKSFQLRSETLLGLMAIELGMMAAITTFWILSTLRSGFVQVTDDSAATSPSSRIWHQGLLWTSLPSLLVSVYSAFKTSVSNSLAQRQPFIGMDSERGVATKVSATLDYGAKFPPVASYKALRNGHMVVFVGLVLAQLAQYGLVPLTARLFATSNVDQVRDANMTIMTDFDDLRFTPSTNLQPVFDIVAAVQISHGSPPAKTDMHYAFPIFHLTHGLPLSAGGRNISLELTARLAELDCRTIRNFTYSTNSGQVILSAWDRGCQITQYVSPSSKPAFYFPTSPTIDCASLTTPSRLVLAAGEFDARSVTLLKNLSLISCTPKYLATNGTLELSPGFANTTISRFSPASPAQAQHFWPWHGFESALNQVGYYDPESNVSTTGLGNLILTLAQQTQSDAISHPDVLADAAEKIFSSVFAVLAATVLFSSSTKPSFAVGLISETHTRLFVVVAVAAAMVSVLGCAALGSVFIFLRDRRTTSVLLEEPASLAGFANLLFGSGLLQLVAEMRERHDYDGKFVDYFKRNYDGRLSKVKVEGSSSETSRIVFSSLKHKVWNYDSQK